MTQHLNPQNIADTERRAEAVRLRLQGLTFEEIADRCGYYDKAAAYRAIRSAVQRIGRDDAQMLFDEDMARLDRLLVAVWPGAMTGDEKLVKRALDIIARRARMLGYDGQVPANPEAADATGTGQARTLADVLGSDAPELQQAFARILNDSLPAARPEQE